MESWRPRSPDTSSSDEEDRDVKDRDPVKRSYECTFCKRGFTNAQALGGHMNIHRKDRAKAKQVLNIPGTNHISSINNYSNNYHQYQFGGGPVSSQAGSGFYPVLDQMSYHQMYFQPSGARTTSYGYEHDDPSSIGSRSSTLGMNQDLWGANLSLRLEDDEYRRGLRSNDDLDLELRLGH